MKLSIKNDMNKIELLNIPYVSNEKISNITTYKTQGTVKGVFYPRNQKELILIYNFLKQMEFPFKVIGNGSNLLIKDNCDYLFICTKKMQEKIVVIKNNVYVPASSTLAKTFSVCAKKGLSGFERLACIPATIGGALKMNASAFGSTVFDNVEKIKVFYNGKIQVLKKEDVDKDYHTTNLEKYLILSAKFKLKEKQIHEIYNEFGKFAKIRGDRQPKEFSCGSVFRNPQNYSAGNLIELCNLKGLSKNSAKISEKHGNFIVNSNNASFEDIKYLIELCKSQIKQNFDISLQTEVEIIE